MKKFVSVLLVLAISLLVVGTAMARPPEDLQCPDGWLAKLEIDPLNWEVAVSGSYGMSSDTGFQYSILNIWSDTHFLTGFCVKAGAGNTGILPMSALPYYTEDPAISHVVIYGDQEYQECSETVPGEKVFGDWYPIGDERWNDWIEEGDSRFRTGSQLWGRDWYQNFYDAENQELICDVSEGTQKRGQLMKEDEEVPCIGMYYLPGNLYYDYPCYLTRNPETDSPFHLPERFDGTQYMQDLCNQLWTCDGWTTGNFNWSGEWYFVCEYEKCLDCE